MSTQPILDACCGSRMMWFDRQNPHVVFGDRRSETLTVTDNSHGNTSGTRTIQIKPDTLMDFRAMPFADGTFKLVAFDPPHLVHAGPKSWLAAKYGKLSDDWREDLSKGFAECFRVLASDGVLVFKWNETQVKLREVMSLTPHQPLFGHTTGSKAGTHWMIFMKGGD
jgi:SAM-dependent methyltransferase